MEQAIEFEARRQIEILEGGGKIEQETRLYDPDRNETRSMRTKEDAQDYRYFPDPDLLPLVISEKQIEQIRKDLPELPGAKRERYMRDLQLTAYDAGLLVESKEKADYFERSLSASEVIQTVKIPPKSIVNWINGELSATINLKDLDFGRMPIGEEPFVALLARIHDGTISQKTAKDVIVDMWDTGEAPDQIIEKKGLKQVSDAGAIEKLVDEVLAKNAKQVEDYRAGKEKAFNSLVGQVMKATQGKANPAQVNEVLRKKLGR
jgi:aspartyl-tRNA(Asn)/glutamyl-tRNA(Gln) amidotransferase subunit B